MASQCVYCHQRGHKIARCPIVKCRRCGRVGHTHDVCLNSDVTPLGWVPTPIQTSTESTPLTPPVKCQRCSRSHPTEKCKKCDHCGKYGHLEKECTIPDCDKCGKIGHRGEDCWFCEFCQIHGHKTDVCFIKKNYEKMNQEFEKSVTVFQCSKCYKKGHTSKECVAKAWCFGCDEEHFLSECPNLGMYKCTFCGAKGHIEQICNSEGKYKTGKVIIL